MYYSLVIQQNGSERTGRPEDFETTCRNIAALFEEGHRKVEVRVWEPRAATHDEVQNLVARASGLLES